MSEQIGEIKDKMIHPKAAPLNISRVPIGPLDVFKKFANDEFAGDYGMAFKYVVEKVLIEPQPFIQVYGLLSNHEERLAKLEGTKPTKIIKTLDGKIKKIIKEDE